MIAYWCYRQNVVKEYWHFIIFWFATVHGLEYGFGAHDLPLSGVFEVEPRNCPGFIYRCSIFLGYTKMLRSEFRAFMENIVSEYHGDTYHLIFKNCNHFTDDICSRLTGKRIPGWVNRLAHLGTFPFLCKEISVLFSLCKDFTISFSFSLHI